MTTEKSQYEQLGIDASKKRVKEIFSRIIRNDFPGAFVNIARADVPGLVFTKHPDGDGSKFVQRLLHYAETGDKQIIQGAVDDAFAMNYGDIAASGFVFGPSVITQMININGLEVPKEIIMEQIAERVESLLELYRSHGFRPVFLGGETADLPDQVNSVVYDVDVYAEAQEADLIRGNVKPGDRIYGLASDGLAAWETDYNSGIMANGLTLGRLCTMQADYNQKYPHLIRRGGGYKGTFSVTEKSTRFKGLSVSWALLSPTRQWAIFIRRLATELKRHNIFYLLHGISLNTGGGATKITNLGQGILYTKTMPAPPPIFLQIQGESAESWRDMYRGFNCGVGLDVVGQDDQRFLNVLKRVSQEARIRMFPLGICSQNPSGGNSVALKTPFGHFDDY